MKKTFRFFLLAATSALVFASCQKEAEILNEDVIVPQDDNTVLLTINAGMPEGDEVTKTAITGGDTPTWKAGDKVTVVYTNNSDAVVTAESSPLAADNTDATFSVSLSDPKTAVNGYAYYPANNKSATASTATLVIDDEQSPLGTTFDGASDILISQGFTPSGSVDTKFRRLGAVLRIKLSNASLASDKIVSLSVQGTNSLAGDVAVRLSDGVATGISNGSNKVTATYESANQFTLNADGKYVYLIVYPQTLAKDSHLIISGETTNATFEKDITLPKDIVLSPGHIQPLNISITSITLKDKVFFEERFLDADGTGGNDGSWSGNVASSTFSATGWTATKSYYGKQCARFGNSSNNGNATTPAITIPAAYQGSTIQLFVKAGAWSGKGTTLGLSVDGATPSSTSLTLKDAAWDTYSLTLTTITKSSIKISFSKSDQWFLDQILVYYGSKPSIEAGLEYAETAVVKTYGDAAFTNSLTNPNNLTVSYESSDTDVATVNSSTGAVTIVKAGTTRITASFAGNSDYASGSAYYDLTVSKAAAGLAYAVEEVAKNIGDAKFTNPLTNPHDLAVTYDSTDKDVATVDSNGEVTIKAGGSTIISATFEANDYYLEGEAIYELTVKKAIKTMSFASPSVDVDENDTVALPSLTIKDSGDNDISGDVTVIYTSSNTDIAEEDSGDIYGWAPGHITLTASITGDAEYEDKSTTLNVYVLGTLAAPTGVTLSTLDKKTLKASWTAALGAESYSWELINTSTSAVAKSGTTTETSLDIDYSASNIPSGTYKLSVISTLTTSHAGITNSSAGESGTKTVTSQVTVNFAPSDFSGQGTISTGSEVSVTKSGVTISTDKGYGTEQFRVYKGGNLTISAGTNTIKTISFTFTGTSNDGNLDSTYSDVNASSKTFSNLEEQARITAITVVYE